MIVHEDDFRLEQEVDEVIRGGCVGELLEPLEEQAFVR